MSLHAQCDMLYERTGENDDAQVQIQTSFYFLMENAPTFENKYT